MSQSFLDRVRAADPERHARRLAPAGALLCLAGAALADGTGAALALFGLCLLLLCCVSRESGLLILGPFARWELVRAARHKRPPALWRAAYAASAFALLGLVYLIVQAEPRGRWSQPGARLEQVAVSFFTVFVFFQLVLLASLTVRLVAPVVAEERERKQLDFLLVTDLRNREILFGKAAGRLPQLLDPLLASLPILAVLPLFGGVPPGFVVAAVVATLATVLALAGVAFYCSVKSQNREHAYGTTIGVVMAYFVLAQLLWLFSLWPAVWNFAVVSVGVADVVRAVHAGNPFVWAVRCAQAITRGADAEVTILAAARWYSVFQVGVCAALGLLAAARLRHAEVWPTKPVQKLPKAGRAARVLVRPPVGDEPIAWHVRYKQTWYRSPPRPWVRVVKPLAWGVGLVVAAHLVPLTGWRFTPDAAKFVVYWLAVGLSVMTPLILAAVASETIPRERKSDTLEALLLTGLGCREVLRQKWRGVMLTVRGGYFLLLGVLAAGVVSGKVHPLSAAVLALIVPIHAAFWTSYGLALGVRAKTPDKAAGPVFLTMIPLAFLGVLLAGGAQLLTHDTAGQLGLAVAAAYFPPVAAATTALLPEMLKLPQWADQVPMVLAAGVAGTLLIARVAVWLFEVAVRRFEREWEGRP